MIDCFVLFPAQADVFASEPLVRSVCVVEEPLSSGATVRKIAEAAGAEYTLVYTRPTAIRLVQRALERFVQVAEYTGAAMVYSDRFVSKGDSLVQYPVIDCQTGSLRDDFDFGGLLLFRTDVLKAAAAEVPEDIDYAGLYALRLAVSRRRLPEHIPEYLYYEVETDLRTSGEKQFDYVNPRNREVQVEMELSVNEHLKAIGAFLTPRSGGIDLSEGDFEVEASVVIPCRNRVQTIGDAIRSALSQDAPFPYNVIVVDDNSTDGTVDVIKSFLGDPRVVYIPQDPSWHAIGGNWNAAIHSPRCGRFALQLDSDDVYSGPDTVRKFVEGFYRERCAMVIGCYAMTDFDLNPIPPFVIEHREWTDENGHNNALRINGLGAPRGFFVPVLRKIGFPVTKYGEDYAVGLRISREYRIGRIWDVLYNCRRWEHNSDSDLSVEKVNANNFYKDKLRSWEIAARIELNNSAL